MALPAFIPVIATILGGLSKSEGMKKVATAISVMNQNKKEENTP